ncbi:MAG: hypothetical protein M3P38_13200, partial [Chloroflexota bacterium]|nr:hypothetical protein [Chloroflexota bacterium]
TAVVVFNGDAKASHTVRVPLASLGVGNDVTASDALATQGVDVASRDGVLSIDVPARGASVWLVTARSPQGLPLLAIAVLVVVLTFAGGFALRRRLS